MEKKEASKVQEKRIAKLLGGYLPPNSGGTRFGGGDILTDKFLIEAKTTSSEKKSFSIKKEWIEKAKEQCFEQNKEKCAIAFQFEPLGENYFILSEKDFIEYVEYIESEK